MQREGETDRVHAPALAHRAQDHLDVAEKPRALPVLVPVGGYVDDLDAFLPTPMRGDLIGTIGNAFAPGARSAL